MNPFSRDPFSEKPEGLGGRMAGLPRRVKWAAITLAVLALGFVSWLTVDGLNAKSNLEQAQSNAQQAKDALLNSDSEGAARFAESAQFHARQAQSSTHSLPWNVIAALPWVGSPLKATQQISDVVVGLADDILVPGAGIGAALSPDRLIEGTKINLKLLREEEPRLNELSAAAAELNDQAQSIADPAYLSLIRTARAELQDQISRLAKVLSDAAIAAELAPSMLGADGPRTYLVALQNNAEARGTGGLLGGFGILVFNNGTPTVPGLATNTSLGGQSAKVDLGPEFNASYGWTNPYTDFRNSNLSPHFPYAAQIWKSMWDENVSPVDKPVDGVIAIDPVALSYILGAIGPVALPDGETVTRDNVVELMESAAYVKYPTEQESLARKKYLQGVAEAVVKKATSGGIPPRKLLDALAEAVSERRIAVWSSIPAEQTLLEKTPLAHQVPDDAAPFVAVVINNLAGNKMDYYLRRQIEYAADSCQGDTRNSTVTITLENTAPDIPLPEYVAGSEGLAKDLKLEVPKGTMIDSVRLIATKGAKLVSVTANGKKTPANVGRERGHPSFEVQVAIPRGQSGQLVFQLSEPTAPGSPRVPIQPLIDNPNVAISVPECPEPTR